MFKNIFVFGDISKLSNSIILFISFLKTTDKLIDIESNFQTKKNQNNNQFYFFFRNCVISN